MIGLIDEFRPHPSAASSANPQHPSSPRPSECGSIRAYMRDGMREWTCLGSRCMRKVVQVQVHIWSVIRLTHPVLWLSEVHGNLTRIFSEGGIGKKGASQNEMKSKIFTRQASRLPYTYGHFCAANPCRVIFGARNRHSILKLGTWILRLWVQSGKLS